MANKNTLVLVVGTTGRIGRSVIDGLLKSGQYDVAALTRPASISKPEVEALRSQGVEIRVGDFATDSALKLAEHLRDIDILISTVSAQAIAQQKPILKAAVDAGVKRIIPCDFGTPGAKGLRVLYDLKLDIREYLKGLCAASNGVSAYTFVDIGWYMHYTVPSSTKVPSHYGSLTDEYYAEDDKPVLLTDVDRIGPYVARIIADSQTANQYVIIWHDELTLWASREIAEAATGEAQAIREARVVIDKEAVLKRMEENKAQYNATGAYEALLLWVHSGYMLSLHFLGENSLANAKKLGALDARELYPDIPGVSFEQFTKEHYA